MKYYGLILKFLFIALLVSIATLLLSNLIILQTIDQKMVIMIICAILLTGDFCYLFNCRRLTGEEFIIACLWPGDLIFYWESFDEIN